MPIYEYKCKNCEHKEERLESIHAPTNQVCGICGHQTLNRIISNSSFKMDTDWQKHVN